MNFGKVALLALAGASMVFFASCGKDQKQAAPTISVKNTNNKDLGKDGAVKTDFPLIVSAKAAEGLKVSELSFTVKYKNAEGNPSEQKEKKISAKNETIGYTGKIELTDLPASINEGTIIIYALDSQKNKSQTEIKYNFGTPDPNKPEEAAWDAVKEGYLNHKAAANPGAFNLKTGKAVSITTGDAAGRYMMNTSQGNNGEFQASFTSDKVTIKAEGQQTGKDYEGNKTVFLKAAGKDFDKLTVKEAEEMIKSTTNMTVENAQVGDIYIAKHNAELYLIKITNIDKTKIRTNKGVMEFTYKAKK